MDEEEREVTRKTWWIMGIILLVLVIGAGGYYIWLQQEQMKEMNDMFELEKASLFDQSEEILLQYEGYKFSIGNDSLIALLVTEQEKVQRLQEELRTVKSTNVRRINELNRELETLRKIMRNYVVQIDSLNTENDKLKNENAQVTRRLQQTSSQVASLSKEREQLTERVQRAARLDAVNIQVSLINARGRIVKNIRNNPDKLKLTFIISKNSTAPVGEQIIYVRLMKPDGDILKEPNYGYFRFENKDIEYSMRKLIEYDGEEQSIEMYLSIGGTYISPGTFRAEIYTEGNLIGKKEFVLE